MSPLAKPSQSHEIFGITSSTVTTLNGGWFLGSIRSYASTIKRKEKLKKSTIRIAKRSNKFHDLTMAQQL